MTADLTARYLHADPSPEGPQAVLAVVEPNGDVHVVRCLVRGEATDLGGDDESLRYLFTRYGLPYVMSLTRSTVLGS